MRLPKQVLVIPYRVINKDVEYCIFQRTDMQIWQWISGGVEDFDEDIISAARREIYEETNISNISKIVELEGFAKIPVVNIVKEFMWGDNIFYSDEYAFAVNIGNKKIKIGEEHIKFKWVSYSEAKDLLRYDSNKSALWELDEKIKRGLIK